MRSKIIKIGNSRGIRIPKPLIEASGLGGEVEITAKQGALVIESVDHPRRGWDEEFERMASEGNDVLLDGDQLEATIWDAEGWEW